MMPATGPPVIPWIVHHAGPHRIQFNITHARQQVTLAVDQTRFETPFEERSGALVGLIDVTDIPPADRLHQTGNPARSLAHCQQMNMIRHLHECVKLAVVLHQGFTQIFEIDRVIIFIKENRLAIIAALHNVLRNIRQVEARETRHGFGMFKGLTK
jgi:phosphopantetheinyl transferase